jgi:hypothetical protein
MPLDHFGLDPEHIKFIRFQAEIVLPSGVSQKSVSRAAEGLTARPFDPGCRSPKFPV